MSELTGEDRANLTRLARIHCPHGQCNCPDRRRGIADLLRADMPELDDVTLSRVLLKAGGLLAYYVFMDRLSGQGAVGVITGAAVELAALEIGDIPQ